MTAHFSVRLQQHSHADRAFIRGLGVPALVIATMALFSLSFATPRPTPERPGPSLLAAELPATPSRVAPITIDDGGSAEEISAPRFLDSRDPSPAIRVRDPSHGREPARALRRS